MCTLLLRLSVKKSCITEKSSDDWAQFARALLEENKPIGSIYFVMYGRITKLTLKRSRLFVETLMPSECEKQLSGRNLSPFVCFSCFL